MCVILYQVNGDTALTILTILKVYLLNYRLGIGKGQIGV